MKKSLTVCLLLAALVPPTWADFDWPAEQVFVRINGQPIRAYWKDGKPYVEREATVHLLHLHSGPSEVDLGQAMAERGYTMTQKSDGSVDCTKTEVTSAPAPASQSGARQPTSQAAQFQREYRDQQVAEALAPRLAVSGYRYVAETDYIRAYCVVRNVGLAATPACTAVGEFVDWYGRPFAKHNLPLPPLQPGQSTDMTFFSLVRKDETQPNGVIKADKYTCRVTFDGLPTVQSHSTYTPPPTRSQPTKLGGGFKIDSTFQQPKDTNIHF